MDDRYAILRERMVEEQIRRRGIRDPLVLAAFRKVPRHLFVPENLRDEAYRDYPLPIGYGQTISQPYMVAVMLEKARLSPGHRVLEIGTGSGYQTALLAEIVKEVYSVERIPELAGRAREILERLGYGNVKIKVDDGSLGWEEFAPYDRIIVTAAAPSVPEALLKQLSPHGGVLVIPVGERHSQVLTIVEREGNNYKVTEDSPCVFVPLIGREGWED